MSRFLSRPRPAGRLARRSVLALGVGGAAATLGVAAWPAGRTEDPSVDAATAVRAVDAAIAQQVRAEFLHGWQGYCAVAWGRDEVRPVSGQPHDFFAPGRTFGLSIVEALDTLHLMGEDHEVTRCCDWIEQHLDPVQDVDLYVFEAVIRLLGGLLAAHQTTGRAALLARASELADRLLPAFTASPTGLPYTHVNLRTGAVRGQVAALAEIGSNVVEFGLLSRLTGNSRYQDAALRAYRAVLDRRSGLGLLGTSLHVETGRWVDCDSVAPNAPVDSFHEYLWTGGTLLGDPQLLAWYRELTDAVLRRQAVRRAGRLWFRPVDFRTRRPLGGPERAGELGAFYAGLLAKGGNPVEGAACFDAWTAVLDRHDGLLPEVVDCATLAAVDRSGRLRPEYANAAFDLWRVTGDSRYKACAYRWFDAMRVRQRVSGGYSTVRDVNSTAPAVKNAADLTPGYWFAENLKYLWLMFADTPRFNYRTGLLSTEGKVLAGLRRAWL